MNIIHLKPSHGLIMDDERFAAALEELTAAFEQLSIQEPPDDEIHEPRCQHSAKGCPQSPYPYKDHFLPWWAAQRVATVAPTGTTGPPFINTQCRATAMYKGTESLGFDAESGNRAIC